VSWYTYCIWPQKETTLKEVGEMLTHVVEHMATKEDIERSTSVLIASMIG
jgi:hypothetical protein